MSKSCIDCIYHTPEPDDSGTTAWCSKFDKPLSWRRSGEGDDTYTERTQESLFDFANSCKEFTSSGTFLSSASVVSVPVGISTIRSVVSSPDPVTSCVRCAHHREQPQILAQFGWDRSYCVARGELMKPAGLVSQAIDCAFSKAPRVTSVNQSTEGVLLFPGYQQDLSVGSPATVTASVAPANQYDGDDERNKHSVDPREYVTDAPVIDEDIQRGIRAWREVKSPEQGYDSVFMPIFDGTKLLGFDPRTTYGNHQPDLYMDHQGLLYDFAVELTVLGTTPVINGAAGTGKTELGAYLAWLMDLPFYRVSIDKGTETYHLAGESKLVIDEATGNPVTLWKHGRIANIQHPCVFMFDEPNLKGEIFEFLRPLFDSAAQIVLDADQGTTLVKHDFAYLMCSQNPADDPIYVGTEPMSAADMDRVTPFYFDLPEPELERQIIRSHCAKGGYEIPDIKLNKIMAIAENIRAMIEEGSLQIAWGLRAQIKVARKTQFYSMEKAYRRAIIDGLSSDVVDQVVTAVRTEL